MTRLQNRPKWWIKNNDIKVGDLVLIKEDNLPQLKWKLGRITSTHAGQDGQVRAATILTASGEVTRGITKLAPLPYDKEL